MPFYELIALEPKVRDPKSCGHGNHNSCAGGIAETEERSDRFDDENQTDKRRSWRRFDLPSSNRLPATTGFVNGNFISAPISKLPNSPKRFAGNSPSPAIGNKRKPKLYHRFPELPHRQSADSQPQRHNPNVYSILRIQPCTFPTSIIH